MKEYLEFKDEKSAKFWSIELNGKSFTVVFGKIGTTGKSDTKSFASEAEAEKEANKLLNSKLKKGYVKASAPGVQDEDEKIKENSKETATKSGAEETVPSQTIEDDEDWDEDDFELTLEEIRKPEDIKPAAKGADKYVVGAFDEKEYNRHLHKMEDSGRFARLEEFLKELDIVKQYAAMDKPGNYKQTLTATLKWIFDTISFKKNHIKIIETLLKEGAAFESVAKEEIDRRIGDSFWNDRIHPMWMNFVERYRKDPDYTKTATYLEEFLTGLFKQSTDVAIKLVNNLIKEVKSGKYPKFKGQKTFPENIRGIKIYIHDYDKVVLYGVTNGSKPTLAEEDLKGINDFHKSLVAEYALEYFSSQFTEKINKDELNSISSGVMRVELEGVEEPIYVSKIESEEVIAQNKALDNKAKQLEETEDWETASELIEEVVNYLVYTDENQERALNIIKRFLYSGNGTAEAKALKALEDYDSGDHRMAWWFERAVYWWKNLSFDWSFRTIKEYALEDKYPPAVAFYKNLLAEGVITAKKEKSANDDEDDDFDEEDDDYYTDEFGYGNEAQVQEFLDKFTEEDKFRETDSVAMRAYSNGRVYIYFKEENEKAYKEALDFLLHLINKDYVRIFEGYQLHAHFVSGPEFIPHVYLPSTQCNTFFAKAVKYENLHDKIRQYVLNGMYMFCRYHDLGDERSTVVGAFAASALALTDKKHLDLAIRYGKQSDGEHEEVQLELAYALESVYGVDKDTAPAIYELIISYDHTEHKVNDAFYKNPEVLEAFTQYLHADDSHFKDGKIVRFMGCLFPKGGLKAKMSALQAFYDKVTDARTKNIYADFYNLVIDSDANLSYSQLKLKPLEYAKAEGGVQHNAKALTLKEERPVIIDIKEAEKRGLDTTIIDKRSGRYSNNFSPPVLTDPRFVESWVANFRKSCEREVYNKIGASGSAWNCLFELDGKWVIDLTAAPYQYGIFIYNGKDKPVILYGPLRYADLQIRLGKRKINESEIEVLIEEYAVPGIETPEGSPIVMPEPPVQKILDEIRIGVIFNNFNVALINIEKIKPEEGDYYKCAQIFKAYIIEQKFKKAKKHNFIFTKDKEDLKQLYADLLKLLPEYEDYWQEKMSKLG